MTNQNLKPDVRGFFDPVTATWSYVVYADGHTDKTLAWSLIRCWITYSFGPHKNRSCRPRDRLHSEERAGSTMGA